MLDYEIVERFNLIWEYFGPEFFGHSKSNKLISSEQKFLDF